MSNGGNFVLLANDGKADRLIHASKLLHQRINDVTCARAEAGYADPTPTLVDLEKTHIIFMNAHYKPFAATGMEYNKVGSGGTVQMNSNVMFSIAQYGDFFNDMVVRAELDSIASSAQTISASDLPGDALVGGNAINGWDGAATGATTTADFSVAGVNQVTYTAVDPFGNELVNSGTAGNVSFRNMVRYCDYPGEQLLKKVKFDVNGNPLDEYNDIVAVLLRKFTIGADKITAYKRLVGQEVCLEGMSGPKIASIGDSHSTLTAAAAAVANPTDTLDSFGAGALFPNTATSSATPSAFLDAAFPDAAWNSAIPSAKDTSVGYQGVARYCTSVMDGLQTPKYQQPASVLWIPLQFWFNKDVRLSIPSVSIPYGQRFIELTLATTQEMVSETPGVYIRQEIIQNVGGATQTQVSYRPFHSPGTVPELTVKRIELYTNNIFVSPEVHDVILKQIGFSLIRVFRVNTSSHSATGTDEKLLNQLKFPIEYMLVGVAPQYNSSRTNPDRATQWHIMGKPFVATVNDQQVVAANTFDAAAAGVLRPIDSVLNSVVPDTYQKVVSTAQKISVSAHAVPLYQEIDQEFFSSYVPFTFGGANIVSPDDNGAMMINFAHFPGSYQPSGHINASRAREFYIRWQSTYTGTSTAVNLYVVGSAINFLLISDGSAVLRFST